MQGFPLTSKIQNGYLESAYVDNRVALKTKIRKQTLYFIFAETIGMKVGILGGGQLGRMLLQAAANYTVTTYVMENDAACPAAHLCHQFVLGDIKKFEDVYSFGKQLDALTIEIESVNVDALEQLEKEGVRVIPSAAAIRTIQNKILQKNLYIEAGIPTAPFVITERKTDLQQHINFLPAAHKLATGGYDGKGVQILNEEKDLDLAFDAPSVLEKKINIKQEIAILVACNEAGKTAIYPPAEMIFDQVLNLLDYQISPAKLEEKVLWKAEAIALKVAKALNSPGLFAIEMFVDPQGEVYVNETAPRVHNSGHHTIEANFCSQYEMLWRILLQFPLGNTAPIQPSAMVNLVGAEGFSGPVFYNGLDKVLEMQQTFVHLYGKTTTKPGRKMGHVTILSNNYQDLTHQAHKIKQLIQVESN